VSQAVCPEGLVTAAAALQTMSREAGIMIARRGEKEWAVGEATAATAVNFGTAVDKFPEKRVHENPGACPRDAPLHGLHCDSWNDELYHRFGR
jgi:hypothetical protein